MYWSFSKISLIWFLLKSSPKYGDFILVRLRLYLAAITKTNILEKIEKSHSLDLPPNLIEQETKLISQSQKKEDIEKNKTQNLNLAKSRIKTGLILNEIAEKNNLKIEESEIKNEIEKQIKSMPGQEKMVMEYYQKNPSAVSSLRGALYEEKIIKLII